MRLFLQDGPARLQILPRSHLREFRDVGAARDFLLPLLAHPGNLAVVRSALGVTGAWSERDLLEELASRIVADGLQVVSCADSWLASIQGTFTESASQAVTPQQQATTPLQDEEAAQTEQQPEEEHFIEIELLDDSGKPVTNEMYVIELPDGSQRTGRTDGDGRARITGIDPGTAKVSFPDLDKKAYEPGGGS